MSRWRATKARQVLSALLRLAGTSTCTLHQLRHAHATELINASVSLVTIRKRLGYKNLQTTLRYVEQSDAVADAELRAWRRRMQAERQRHRERGMRTLPTVTSHL